MLGMSPMRLGESIGAAYQQVHKLERGANGACASMLLKLSHALDVPVEFFFEAIPPLAEKRAARAVDTADVMTTQETEDLVRAYYIIPAPIRDGLYAVVKSVSRATCCDSAGTNQRHRSVTVSMPTWDDPRDPELLAWIAELPPESEYAVREAMRIQFEHCRGVVWRSRINALLREINPSKRQKVHLDREVQKTLRMIREAVRAASHSRSA